MSRFVTVFLSSVIAMAVIGFLLASAMVSPSPMESTNQRLLNCGLPTSAVADAETDSGISYAEIASTSMGPTKAWQATPQSLPQPEFDLYTKIEPSESEKGSIEQIACFKACLQWCAADYSSPSRKHQRRCVLRMSLGRCEVSGLEGQRDVACVPCELRPVSRADGTDTFSID
jgi:hypothetical protein